MQELKGKVAFVTGGSSGLGLGIVKVLAKEGMKVAFTYRRQDHLDDAMAYLQGRPDLLVHPIKLDVTDRQGLAAAKRDIEHVLGPVQVLINNAGVAIHGPVEQATYADWDWIMSVNVGGVVNALVTFLPDMLASGREAHIVNVASMGGLAALGTVGLYTTTKFAVVGLSESLRTDMIGRNIGVSVYCPGTVRSNIADGGRMRPEHFKESGYTPPPAPPPGEKTFMDFAMDAVEAGGHVLDGIKKNQLYIIGHPEYREVLQARHRKIADSISDAAADPVRADSVSFILSNKIYEGA
jgi:NAD(P)-dependent dehydrogenase (short-subunit alcohol dehydrogenase family)